MFARVRFAELTGVSGVAAVSSGDMRGGRWRKRTTARLCGLSALLLASAALTPAMANQVNPQPDNPFDIGTLSGGASSPNAVSADGTTVVGGSDSQGFRFVWGGAGITALANGGAALSEATGVNADGSVIVGWTRSGFAVYRAMVWRPGANTWFDLGPETTAAAVSADGSVVVGQRTDTNTAFRWTLAGMQDLGLLQGTNMSFATGVSSDGTVVVGDANNSWANSRAYRWTVQTQTMLDLGTLNNGSEVHATGVSGDGRVIVGYANDGANGDVQRAYYWTDASGVGTMTSLGILNGGSVSRANATNEDGSVIVGTADIDGQNQTTRGFRWSPATNMITVDQWLTDNGVAVGNNVTKTATGVSGDGSVVVGTLQNNHAYIARGPVPVQTPATGGATTTTAGLIDVTNYQTSLAASPRLAPQVQNAEMVINGAHSSPLFMLLDAGQSSASFTGDGGYTSMKSAQGGIGAGEFGFGRGIEGGWTVRIAGGGQYARMDTPNSGNSVFSSGYIAPDVSYAVGGGVVATLSGYFNWGKADVRRGYLNGVANDSSFGSTATQTYGVRARLDWQDALKLASTGISPFVSYTYLNAQMNGYTETGGSFPVQFNGSREISNAVRIGADATTPLNDQFALVTRFEYGHRFEKTGAGVSGQILGLSAFSIDGAPVQQDWLRGGLGVSYKLGNGDGLVMVNTSNQTGKNTTWVSASYRVKF